MSNKKFLPHFWLGPGYADGFGAYDWEFSEKETPRHKEEYCSMQEHTAVIADLQKQLDEQCRLNGIGSEREARLETKLRIAVEALEFYSQTGGASDTHCRKGCWIGAKQGEKYYWSKP